MLPVLHNAFSFLQSSQLADFTLRCGDFEWKVHHLILASGSRFFEKACQENFKVSLALKKLEMFDGSLLSASQEAKEKLIILHDDEPEMVARMIICLYTTTYPEHGHSRILGGDLNLQDFMTAASTSGNLEKFAFESNEYIIHSHLFALADKYDMPGMKELSLKQFDSIVYDDNERFLDAFDHIYTSTASSNRYLRARAAYLVQKHYNAVMSEPESRIKMQKAFVKHGQLGWDFAANLFRRNELYCKRCETHTATVEHDGDDDHVWDGDWVDGGTCLCSMSKMCGSGVCDKAALKTEWTCCDCRDKKYLEVRERELPL